jgi:hypothetical protein
MRKRFPVSLAIFPSRKTSIKPCLSCKIEFERTVRRSDTDLSRTPGLASGGPGERRRPRLDAALRTSDPPGKAAALGER